MEARGEAAKAGGSPAAPVVTVGPGDRSRLVPGDALVLSAALAAARTLRTARVLVGEDGVVGPV